MKKISLLTFMALAIAIFTTYDQKDGLEIKGPHQVSFQEYRDAQTRYFEVYFVNIQDQSLISSAIRTNEEKINIMGTEIESGDKVYLEAKTDFGGEIKRLHVLKEEKEAKI